MDFKSTSNKPGCSRDFVNEECKVPKQQLNSQGISRIHKQLSYGKKKFLKQYWDIESNSSKKFKNMNDDDTSKDSSNTRNFNRPPKGLRGREIGLWYRDKQLKKKDENRKDNITNRLRISLSLSNDMCNKIENILERNKNKKEDCYSEEFHKYFDVTLKTSFEDHIKTISDDSLNKDHEDSLDCKLLEELESTKNNLEYQKRFSTRKNLPIFNKKEEIINKILENQIILISGDTGCGKTTQIPQFILDYHIKNKSGSLCKIICTQPRRISAITVSERVAWERLEKLGKSVGYQIRLENVFPRDKGCILYCTTGTILRQMESDPLLKKVSYIILDEIHERSVESDILMALLKKICPLRKELKVILMSATFCTEDFSRYFNGCPIINVNGTLFPVKEKYLEDALEETKFDNFPEKLRNETKWFKHLKHNKDVRMMFQNIIEPYAKSIKYKYSEKVIKNILKFSSEEINIDLLNELIFHISTKEPDGAILVFLPGYDKISKVYNKIRESKYYNQNRFLVFPLHSMMPTVDQKIIFDRPPQGVRKIILSTNIGETSITIDDVVYVINSGKIKMQDYDIERNFQTLEEQWVTLANAKQRRGRAGRVQPGICYHLYTRARERYLEEYPSPEILRTKLDGIILSLKLLRINNVREFFSTLINVPHSSVVENSMKLLKRINAIDDKEIITPLGLHLARLPLDPQIGKMILMASLFKCVYPITSCAASLSFRDAFYIPLGKEKLVDKIKAQFADGTKSDHLMLAHVLEDLQDAKNRNDERHFCYENFLSLGTLKQLEKMKGQFCDVLANSSFLVSSNPCDILNNINSSNKKLLRAIICAGLYPNVAFLRNTKRRGRNVNALHMVYTPEDGRVNFHPSSVNSKENSFESSYFVYYMKQKSTSLYLYDTTMIHPLALILFGDEIETGENEQNEEYISVAHEYAFECNENSSNILIKLRNRMDSLLQKKALYPGPIEENTSDADLLEAIVYLLTKETKMMREETTDESE